MLSMLKMFNIIKKRQAKSELTDMQKRLKHVIEKRRGMLRNVQESNKVKAILLRKFFFDNFILFSKRKLGSSILSKDLVTLKKKNKKFKLFKPTLLFKRLFRNSIVYSSGTFFRSGRFFLRHTKKVSWFLCYSFYINKIKTMAMSGMLGSMNGKDRFIFRNYDLKNKKNLSQNYNLQFMKSMLSRSVTSQPNIKLITLKKKNLGIKLQNQKKNVNSPFFDLVPLKSDKFLLVPSSISKDFVLSEMVGEFGFASLSKRFAPLNAMSLFRKRYGFALVKKETEQKSYFTQNSSLRYQGSLTYRYFPDSNKIVRPSIPNNDFYSYYNPSLLLLKFFPVVIITFRANNVFFVLSSGKGEIIASHSVGIGSEFTKSNRRAVFAYDTASRNFAKKVRSITSIVGIRVYGQSKRRFYVLRNLKQEGLRFIFLHDVIPFACNGVKKSRPARKRRR